MALKRTVVASVVLSDRAFASLTMSPGGDIHQFTARLGREAHTWARWYAPERTGELKRKIYSRNHKANATSVYVHVECSAPHAPWVHFGTDEWIKPKSAPMILYAGVITGTRSPASWLSRPPTAGKVGNFRATAGKAISSRDGQVANPFMSKALDFVAQKYQF